MNTSRASVTRLDHVAFVSRDHSRTRDFYERILGLRHLGEGEVVGAAS